MTKEQVVWPNDKRRQAAHYLAAASLLGDHHRFHNLARLNTVGDDFVDFYEIDNWAWSTGERILVDLFLMFAGRNEGPHLSRMFAWLDPDNLNIAGHAIAIATMNHAEVF